MSYIDVNDELKKISELTKIIRESLFECARQSVSGESEKDWQKAESLFSLAKEADLLGTKILKLTEGNSNNQVVDAVSSQAKKPVTRTSSKNKKKKKKAEYPKFVVRGDSLFKIGLKRDGINEYSHSVPLAIYQGVISQLIDISKSQSEFAADDVLSNVDYPDYQVYIVLAVLRNHKILEIPRRGFHKVVSGVEFEQAAFDLWESLSHD